MWVRGLKLTNRQDICDRQVAPRVGAWIETTIRLYQSTITFGVAPRVGAWIETEYLLSTAFNLASHPVWVRGLKPISYYSPIITHESHPVWVRGLKRPVLPQYFRFRQSHPVWVRGLKRGNGYIAQSRGRRTPCGCVD